LVRVLRLRKMYISRYNLVTMPFDLYNFQGKVEECALVESGAMANFIDYKTVARLRLGTQKLDNIRTVKNIDGTIVTLLRALRPDVGGWVTLSPKYWTGVPSDGGQAPYSAVLGKDLSQSSKLARCLSRQCKRMCAKAETSQ